MSITSTSLRESVSYGIILSLSESKWIYWVSIIMDVTMSEKLI